MKGLGEKAGDLPHYVGHRERLKDRFREAGPESLPDYELLELILFQALPRRDTKPIAKALLTRFGSFKEVFAAPETLLREVDGVADSVVLHLKSYQEAARRFALHEIRDRPLLDSWTAVIDYCRTAMAHEAVEQFRIVLRFIDFSFIINWLSGGVPQTSPPRPSSAFLPRFFCL